MKITTRPIFMIDSPGQLNYIFQDITPEYIDMYKDHPRCLIVEDERGKVFLRELIEVNVPREDVVCNTKSVDLSYRLYMDFDPLVRFIKISSREDQALAIPKSELLEKGSVTVVYGVFVIRINVSDNDTSDETINFQIKKSEFFDYHAEKNGIEVSLDKGYLRINDKNTNLNDTYGINTLVANLRDKIWHHDKYINFEIVD